MPPARTEYKIESHPDLTTPPRPTESRLPSSDSVPLRSLPLLAASCHWLLVFLAPGCLSDPGLLPDCGSLSQHLGFFEFVTLAPMYANTPTLSASCPVSYSCHLQYRLDPRRLTHTITGASPVFVGPMFRNGSITHVRLWIIAGHYPSRLSLSPHCAHTALLDAYAPACPLCSPARPGSPIGTPKSLRHLPHDFDADITAGMDGLRLRHELRAFTHPSGISSLAFICSRTMQHCLCISVSWSPSFLRRIIRSL